MKRRSLSPLLLIVVVLCASALALTAEDTLPVRYAGNPLLTHGAPGSYDALKIGPRSIMREGPNDWRMWYEAASAGNQSTAALMTSSDGIAWTRYSGNPVMVPTQAWEGAGGSNHETSPATVLKEKGIYRMWYHGIQGTQRAIGYATSQDGIVWTKYAGNPVLSPGPTGAWDAASIAEPKVIRVGASYLMYYSHATGNHQIGLATSVDGITWTKYVGNPVVRVVSGTWENQLVAFEDVYYDGASFHMWYLGQSNWTLQMGYASSADGRTWTKSAANPILRKPVPPLGMGDDNGMEGSPNVLRLGSSWRIYYGGMQSCCPQVDYIMMATAAVQGSPNRAPVVDAGADRLVARNCQIQLDGTIQDDDVPVALDQVTATWTMDSGPGGVSFTSPGTSDTGASFDTEGVYVVRLTGSDSALASSATATVTVVSPCP